jgi:hypothetical protein
VVSAGSALMTEPTTLPIATRAWCVRDKPSRNGTMAPAGPRPRKFIAVHVAVMRPPSAPGIPAAVLGTARIGTTHDWRATREIWFYGPGATEAEIAALRRFVTENTLPRGSRPRAAGDAGPDTVWSDEPRCRVEVVPLAAFVKLFYAVAWKDQALVAGFELLALFGALAVRAGRRRRGKNGSYRRNAWSLALLEDRNPNTGNVEPPQFLPRIYVDRMASVDIISFGAIRGSKGRAEKGELLDLSNLGYALSSDRREFAEAVEDFTGEIIGGVPDPAGRMRAAGRALVSLADATLGYFDTLHSGLSRASGGPLSETKAFGPGSIARAYARCAGYLPPPAVVPEMIGLAAEANHGAWAGIGVRGRVPVVETDYRRQYAMIYARQGIGDLLAGSRLNFIEATEEIRARAAAMTPLALGPDLNAICLARFRGEPKMTRALFKDIGDRKTEAEDFTLAMVPYWNAEPEPVYLADVVASRLLCGRVPEIVRAWRIEPAEPRQLQITRVMGRRIDPAATPLPLFFAEEGERVRRGEGRYEAIPERVRGHLVTGIKAMGNIAAYGMLLQTTEIDLPHGESEEVTLLTGRGALRAKVAIPEEDAAFTCVPAGGLVAASGRLLLAGLHHAVTKRGGLVAYWDTDSAHICASEEGGEIAIENRAGSFDNPESRRLLSLIQQGGRPVRERQTSLAGPLGRAMIIKLLSYREIDEIIAGFEPLNPFDRSLLPGSPLRLTDQNFDAAGRRVTPEGVYTSTKRYCLISPDGEFSDTKASLIGVPLPPTTDFLEEAWLYIATEFAFGRSAPPWLERPLVREMRVSTPDDAASLAKALPAAWPGMRYCAATAVDAGASKNAADQKIAVAPFDPDPAHWAGLPWRFMDGAAVDGTWFLGTWRQFLDRYIWHRIDTMLGPDGEPCGRYSKGLLRPRPVRAGRRYLTLKDRAAWGDDAEHAFDIPSGDLIDASPSGEMPLGDAGPGEGRETDLWKSAVRPAIEITGVAAVAARRVVSPRTVRQWAAGDRRPEKPALAALAVARTAWDLGLCHDTDDVTGEPFAVCAALPARLAEAKLFNSAMAGMLAARYGGRARLAERLGIAESTVHRAGDGKMAGPVAAFLGRLGRLARIEMRDAGHRVQQIEGGLRGDRQAVVAWLSLICGAKRPVVVSPDGALRLPAEIAGGEDAAAGVSAAGWLSRLSAVPTKLGFAIRRSSPGKLAA